MKGFEVIEANMPEHLIGFISGDKVGIFDTITKEVQTLKLHALELLPLTQGGITPTAEGIRYEMQRQ